MTQMWTCKTMMTKKQLVKYWYRFSQSTSAAWHPCNIYANTVHTPSLHSVVFVIRRTRSFLHISHMYLKRLKLKLISVLVYDCVSPIDLMLSTVHETFITNYRASKQRSHYCDQCLRPHLHVKQGPKQFGDRRRRCLLEFPTPKSPLPAGTSFLIQCNLGSQRVPAKWHLIRSNGFSEEHACDKGHTYRRTDHLQPCRLIKCCTNVLLSPPSERSEWRR